MIPISKPHFKVREVFIACISTVKDEQLKDSLNACVDLIEVAESEFDENFEKLKIHEFTPCDLILGDIGKAEMKSVYDYRMVNSKMPGNPYYNKLRLAAAYGKCPLCSVRDVDTLDHYLPKADFPIFAVTPCTLIPSCTPCNKGKNIAYPKTPEEQTLHPYYDLVNDEQWLKAIIVKTVPVTFSFYVEPDCSWTPLLAKRVQKHFEAFSLDELFTSHANEEFRGAERQLTNLFKKHPSLLIEHLQEAYSSKLAIGLNSWQAATYNALLKDSWFCSGEFLSS